MQQFSLRAIDEARTRDLHLGKVAYYQLYYYRIYEVVHDISVIRAIDEARTRDLHLGKVAYYQLYYYRISTVFCGGQEIIYLSVHRMSTVFLFNSTL